MNANQLCLADACVALINAVLRAAVREEVFCRRNDVPALQKTGLIGDTLQTLQHCLGVLRHKRGIFRVAFVAPSPPLVPRNRDGGGKRPTDTRNPHLRCGHAANLPHQIGVPHGAQTYVVRKHGGTNDVCMSVHGVAAPKYGYGFFGALHGCLVKSVGKREPLTGVCILLATGRRIAPI